MHRVRVAAVAVMTASALLLVGGTGIASAQTTASQTFAKKIAMTGTAKNGKKFSGTFTIERFATKSGKVFAVGTLSGKLKGKHVKRSGVAIPVTPANAPAGSAQAAATCPVLHLVLGPLDLNLLGLRVQLNQVVLDITAISGNTPGAGLLGNLLCGLTNALGTPPALPTNAQALATFLNGVVGLLQGLRL